MYMPGICDIQVEIINARFRGAPAEEVLSYFLTHHRGEVTFASSLGIEDQVLTHLITLIDPNARIFTLDTGKLFPETYDLIDRTNDRFNINIEIFAPVKEQVEAMILEHGADLFYTSLENRRLCCHIRKVEPLRRALKGYQFWIAGLRREQSVTRSDLRLFERDTNNHGMVKINPLIDWTEEDVWNYVTRYDLPYNPLHDQGFPSIGCQPCTRAVEPGMHQRDGRWWWEMARSKECGLHQR